MSEISLTEAAAFDALKRTWQPVALSADIPAGSAIEYCLLDERLFVARMADGRILAGPERCPHKGFRLSQGSCVDGNWVCPYHGWRFDADGRCTAIPSLQDPGDRLLSRASIDAYETAERYGMVWVRLAHDDDTALPDVPEFEDDAWTYVVAPPMPFEAGFRREVENYLDMTHFAFAHAETLGVAADTVVPKMEIEETETGFYAAGPFPALSGEQLGKLQQPHHREYAHHFPNFTVIKQTFEDGDERLLVHVPSPNTSESCTVFWAIALSPSFDGPDPASQVTFSTRVLEEDRMMCENQRPKEVPINPERGGWGVLVTPGDTLANTFQRVFRKRL